MSVNDEIIDARLSADGRCVCLAAVDAPNGDHDVRVGAQPGGNTSPVARSRFRLDHPPPPADFDPTLSARRRRAAVRVRARILGRRGSRYDGTW
jgi:hypothetical protein